RSLGARARPPRNHAGALERDPQRHADRFLQAQALLCAEGRRLMADGMLLQAVADTASAYRDFPVIRSPAAVGIAAEIHLMFAAFVLGVPIFAVVAEGIGIFGKDQRYDRLSKEFTRLLLIAYSATAIWGALLVFLLATMYQTLWAYLTRIFGP